MWKAKVNEKKKQILELASTSCARLRSTDKGKKSSEVQHKRILVRIENFELKKFAKYTV